MDWVIKERQRHRICREDKLVVVTAGGGGDGYPLMDDYLKMLDLYGYDIPYRSIIITGPFMPEKQQREILKRKELT